MCLTNKLTRLLLFILLMFTVYCTGGKPSENAAAMIPDQPDFNTLHKGVLNNPSDGSYNLNSEQVQLHRISTADEWETYLDQAMPDRHERDAFPDSVKRGPDFSQSEILALSAGQRPSSGYNISVDAVTHIDGLLTISAVETVPGRNCMLLSVLTFPFHYVIVAKNDIPLNLVVTEEVADC